MARVAVACRGACLDDPVDYYLGLAPWFLIVDPETMELQLLENMAFACQGCGLSDDVLEKMAQQDVEMVLTGFADPNEIEAVGDVGIKIGLGWDGFSAMEVIDHYKNRMIDAVCERHYLI